MLTVELVSQLGPLHLAQLPDLLSAARRADGHDPIGEHKFLRLQQQDDLASAIVAYDDGRLIGYAHTLAYRQDEGMRVSCEFVVHPEARASGLESDLIGRIIEHARTQNAARIDLWAYNDSTSSHRSILPFRFAPQRRLLHLHRHVREAPRVVAPGALSVRPFDSEADAAVILSLNNRIFSAHPEQGTWTANDMATRMAQPWFRPDDLLILQFEGAPVGFCWLKVEERGEEGLVGEIYVVGIAPEARGAGAGRYLLERGLRRLADLRVRVAAVYVEESNAAAVRLYESSGFHSHHVDVCYTLDLTAIAFDPRETAA
jgi:mycothiol synthase